MRSLLFVPGNSVRKLESGFRSQADVVIVDLEDSVALPAKPEARSIAAATVPALRDESGPGVYFRVNDLSTGLIDADLAALMPLQPDGIMLPKSGSGADVQLLAAKLRVHEARNAIADGTTKILPIISETAAAVFTGASYADASSRLSGLTWGAEDLSAAVGAQAARDDAGRYTDVFRLARTLTILAASAAGVAAVDTVFPDFRNLEAFEAECREAARDGFTAKVAIHPSQVTIINAAFTPSVEAVERASAIVAAFADAEDGGVVAIDGRMYDRPHLRQAERILERARSLA